MAKQTTQVYAQIKKKHVAEPILLCYVLGAALFNSLSSCRQQSATG